MTERALEDLQRRIDAAVTVDADLLAEVVAELRGVFPKVTQHPDPAAEPTEAALHLIDACLPGWTITLHGTASEPDGHWRCALRESGAHDNDRVIGHGKAPAVSLALLRALVGAARAMA